MSMQENTTKVNSIISKAKEKVESAERQFKHESRRIERKSRNSIIDIYNMSEAVAIVAAAKRATDELYTSYEAVVQIVDMQCRPLLQNGLEASAIKEVADFIKRINNEALRMKDLVIDMLTLSRIEANWKETVDEKLDIKEVILSVFESNRIKAEQRNMSIDLDIESAIIMANKEKITEVVNNLVDNAIKYTDDGGIVKISLKKKDSKAIFSVKDTGCGIAPQYLNRIFERFFRVKNNKYLKVQGTGLGLTIVKNICNYYNADIHITSEENVGTEMTVVFNLYKDVEKLENKEKIENSIETKEK